MNHGDQTQRDRQARDIFLRAIEIKSQEARAAYLEGACGKDDSLRSRVDALIASHTDDSFIEAPAIDASATELEGAGTFLDESVIEEGAASLRTSNAYNTYSNFKPEAVGTYQLRMYNAQDHMIGRRTFVVQ